MTKALTYSGLAVASLIAIFAFVTAQTYSQLIAAAIFYPALVFIALKIFPRSASFHPKFAATNYQPEPQHIETPKPNRARNETTFVADIDRRAFIKLVGATGISFFLFSLLGRRVDALLFGRSSQQLGFSPAGTNNQATPAAAQSPTEGYKITEISEGVVSFYGFTNQEGGWLVMREDSSENNFRYAKGKSDFPGNWKNRENLKYDYFYNLK